MRRWLDGGPLDLGIDPPPVRNHYEIFMEERIVFGPIQARPNYSPGCDYTCPARAYPGRACECGAQEFYYRVHQWHGMFSHYIDTPCPCFPCRLKK